MICYSSITNHANSLFCFLLNYVNEKAIVDAWGDDAIIINLWTIFTERPYHRVSQIRQEIGCYTHHDDVIIWKHFSRYWPFVRGIHRSPVNSPYKGQWRGALIFALICAWVNGWVNKREAGDLIRHRAHYDVIVMSYCSEIVEHCRDAL